MKFAQLLLLLLLSSCASTAVFLKHPTPKRKLNQSEFAEDLIGEYTVTDPVFDEGFYTALNDIYQPSILLDTDTSFVVTTNISVVISKYMIVSKRIETAYMTKTLYESNRNNSQDEIDTIIFIGPAVKMISKVEIDTIINIGGQDIVRTFKDHYMLNKLYENGYQPILLKKNRTGQWALMDLNKVTLLDTYYVGLSKKVESNADLVSDDEAIGLKNSELKSLLEQGYFETRYTLLKNDN